MDISSPVEKIPTIGPSSASKLAKLGVETVLDLLSYAPFRYEDFSSVLPISKVRVGQTVTIKGKLVSLNQIFTKTGKNMQIGEVKDETGSLKVIWFNQRYLLKSLPLGSFLNLSGKIGWWEKRPALTSPKYEKATDDSIHTGRLVPIYHETNGLSSKWLRDKLAKLLSSSIQIEDSLPQKIIEAENLLPLAEAIKALHFPKSLDIAQKAKTRLAFDELFLYQLKGEVDRLRWLENCRSNSFKLSNLEKENFINSLPFRLTDDQLTSIGEILEDLSHTTPMNRLLEGDVGSGKTVVCCVAALAVCRGGKQVLLMAPTQILANQHFSTINRFLSPFNFSASLVTASTNKKQINWNSNILVGTHALLSSEEIEKNPNIGLVIIDEQQRFGVLQRSKFVEGRKVTPHLLTMTATPIPRTIALTLFGNLSLSQIKTMPEGREKVSTWVVPRAKRESAYEWMKREIRSHDSQAFVVCPFIEPSESAISVKSATSEFEKLKVIFSDFRLAMLHGRMKPKDKDKIMEDMKSGHFDILVTTPVVEVGIDIPRATVVLIEDAEKFGLSQIHQLRGRVGRSSLKSYCLLFTSQDPPAQRIKALEKIHSGLELSELDLKLRGPGEVYGISQHGFAVLKVASFTDEILIKKTKSWAKIIGKDLPTYPRLHELVRKVKIPQVQPN
jgi:ATP-dependent DNA helicase RecG